MSDDGGIAGQHREDSGPSSTVLAEEGAQSSSKAAETEEFARPSRTNLARDAGEGIEDFGWLIGQFALRDVLTTDSHSRDFSGSRAEYIAVRVRLVAFLLAMLTPLWIIVDLLVAPTPAAPSIVVLRIATAALFLALGLWSSRPHNLTFARVRLLLLVLIGAFFYVGSRLVLDSGLDQGFLVGYAFLPFLLVAVLAVFPLTVIEGFALALVTAATVGVVDAFKGTLLAVEFLGGFWLIGLLAAVAIAAQVSQLQMLLQLHRQATRDALTGLFNRRALMEMLEVEIARVRRYGGKLSVFLVDIDRFKRVNYEYGHLTGDSILRTLAHYLGSELRSCDISGRYGGEEFLAVLPETGIGGARTVAERLRIKCEETPSHGPLGRTVNFTISIGVAEYAGDDSASAIFKRVDDSLYQAKASGRNCIVVASPAG